MKTFRVLGAVFVIFGITFALVGILTALFPLIENEQFKLILNSFQETSADPLTNSLNAVVRFCLRSSYFLLFSGISLTVTGGLISSCAHKKAKANHTPVDADPHTAQEIDSPGVPRPAYYPGGLSPSVLSDPYTPEPDTPEESKDDIPGYTIKTSGKPGPISGGVEPALLSDENDAQKLMRHDRQMSEYTQPAPATTTVPTRTPEEAHPSDHSNTALETNRELLKEQPPKSQAETPAAPVFRPRIVSTMGKRKNSSTQSS